MFCDGEETCQYANIKNVDNIEAWGKNSLRSATIMSNGGYNGSNALRVIINSNIQDDPYTIECSINDICFVNCKSNNSCINLNLECYGTCYVYCNDQQGM